MVIFWVLWMICSASALSGQEKKRSMNGRMKSGYTCSRSVFLLMDDG